ncbi:hypothetical protein NKR19_g1476 [Coniochaeta hoffmannii]|uniref:Uncharacterized protein n=1 Tax=Coniochaeta hoffmannii TaxID=91930 RepID=A0AA38SCA4_9PEZI|nr:hypothetical protein NKR19_g1476 [Coniochaeta hoffmannii]
MKFTSVIVSALAAVATAAPAKSVEERGANIDLAGLNNLQSFGAIDIQYLAQVNSLDLNLLLALGQNQGLNINSFNSLFQSSSFDLASILQLQQLQTLLAIAQTGALNSFDLSSINLQQQLLQLGLIQNLNSFSFSSLIDQSLVPQIQTIAQQFVTVIAKE